MFQKTPGFICDFIFGGVVFAVFLFIMSECVRIRPELQGGRRTRQLFFKYFFLNMKRWLPHAFSQTAVYVFSLVFFLDMMEYTPTPITFHITLLL